MHMQLYLFLLFLVHLAGLMVCTRAQEPECSIYYGVNINHMDCIHSITDHYESLVRGEPVLTGEALFSRHRTISSLRATLPQAYPYQTCSIGIDVANPVGPPIRAPYRDIFQNMLSLYDTCVQGRQSGGSLERHGLVYVIVHTASPVAQGSCLEPRTVPLVNLAECISQKAQAVEMSMAAPTTWVRGSASGLTPPALPPLPQLRSPSQVPSPPLVPSPSPTDPLAEFDSIEPLLLQGSRGHMTFEEQLDALVTTNPSPQPTT